MPYAFPVSVVPCTSRAVQSASVGASSSVIVTVTVHEDTKCVVSSTRYVTVVFTLSCTPTYGNVVPTVVMSTYGNWYVVLAVDAFV